ncbi:hypothetical protein J437_LFUL003113 [Ladona fulva]|uniref:Methuselah N-terminal domain-containing protein n=1 Tax=Ladona fulva TaxID=123851 RepID=A0A8K0JWM3_LADFU|nr:hypothetical protein J437_LFUL003113 [Ladona fulva]
MAFFGILILGVLHASVASTEVKEEFPLLCNNSVVLSLENIEAHDDGSVYDPKSRAIYPKGTYWKDEEHRIVYGCPCDLERPCLWKCCPYNQAIHSTSNNCTAHSSKANWFKPVVKSDDGKSNRSVIGHDHFVVFYGHCGEGMSMIPEEEYIHRGADGSMVLHKGEEPFQMEPDTFCVDYAVDLERYVAYHCSNDSGVKEEPEAPPSTCRTIIYIVYPIGMCISIIFLIISFFVYASMPELRNLHGKCLLCHIASLLTAYVFLVLVQVLGFVITDDACHAAADESRLAYFIGPVATIITVNIALFVFTAVKIFKLKKQTKMLKKGDSRRHSENDENRQRFNLYLKLFIVMGVNWALEIISWLAGGSECIWIPADLFNTLQGLFIFMIFVWKAKIRRKLIKRLCPRFASSMKKHTKPGSSSSDGRSICTVSSTVADGDIKLSSSVANTTNNSKVT